MMTNELSHRLQSAGRLSLGALLCACTLSTAAEATREHSISLAADVDGSGAGSGQVTLGLALPAGNQLRLSAGSSVGDDQGELRFFEGQWSKDLGAFRLGASAGWWDDEAIATDRTIGLLFGVSGASFFADLYAQWRDSNFSDQPFDFEFAIADNPLTLSGNAACDARSYGAGGTLGTLTDRWSGYLGGTAYHFDDTQCDLDAPQLRLLAGSERTRAQTLAARLAESLTRAANAWTDRQILYLDYELSTGIGYQTSGPRWQLDYQYGQAAFNDEHYHTLTATLGFQLNPDLLLDLYAGAAEDDSQNSAAFAGFRIQHWF